MSSLCFTGCRPHKINMPYDISAPEYKPLIDTITKKVLYYIQLGVDTFYTGGADGIDILSFFVIHKLKKDYPNLKNIICIPTSKQREWSKSGKWYDIMLKYADETVLVYEIDKYKSDNINAKMQNRNQYMVDNSDFVLAVWNGDTGGTFNCINYANKSNKEISYIILGDCMEIIKINKTNEIKQELNGIMELVKGTNAINPEIIVNTLGKLQENLAEHNNVKVVFEENYQIDDVLKEYPIESINFDTKEVVFLNDKHKITVQIV